MLRSRPLPLSLTITLVALLTSLISAMLLGGCNSVNTPDVNPTPPAQPENTAAPAVPEALPTAGPTATPGPKTPADYLAELQDRTPLEPVMVPDQFTQKFRPQFHFSPIKGWIGDPDGTIHYKGKYHLFWWGHAESPDLVHWQQRPFPQVNLPGVDSGSGSVIIDERNASGFAIPGQNPPMLAFFTIFDAGDGHQAPGLAVSYDYTNFAYYDQNPLIVHEEKGFRDPHVFYYAPTDSYVMAIAIADRRQVGFYGSKDLKHWEHLSDFGPVGASSQVWECPDLFTMSVDGDSNHLKWVMLIGMGPNTEQYFIGDFDGTKFTLDPEAQAYLLKGTGLPGKVFADFEDGLPEGWTVEGSPVTVGAGDNLGTHHISGALGSGFLSTYTAGDANGHRGKSTVTSPAFTIEKRFINFLLASGTKSSETAVKLIVDGQAVLSASGDDSDIMRWVAWDVAKYVGKSAQIQVLDNRTASIGGFVNIDHILFSESPSLAGREHANWLDFGPDYYAVRSYNDYDNPDSKKVLMAWLGNWEYATVVPTGWGRGAQALPREIDLKTVDGGLRIYQDPIPAFEGLRQSPVQVEKRTVSGVLPLSEFKPARNTYEIDATFDISDPQAQFGFNVAVGGGYRISVGYDAGTSTLFLDRTNAENASFNGRFAKYQTAYLPAQEGKVRLHFYVDQSSIEVFANDGEVAMSALIFPEPGSLGIELFSQNGSVTLSSLTAWELDSTWGVPAKK